MAADPSFWAPWLAPSQPIATSHRRSSTRLPLRSFWVRIVRPPPTYDPSAAPTATTAKAAVTTGTRPKIAIVIGVREGWAAVEDPERRLPWWRIWGLKYAFTINTAKRESTERAAAESPEGSSSLILFLISRDRFVAVMFHLSLVPASRPLSVVQCNPNRAGKTLAGFDNPPIWFGKVTSATQCQFYPPRGSTPPWAIRDTLARVPFSWRITVQRTAPGKGTTRILQRSIGITMLQPSANSSDYPTDISVDCCYRKLEEAASPAGSTSRFPSSTATSYGEPPKVDLVDPYPESPP